MTKALVLTAITGSQAGKRLTLSERVNTIGSGPGNTVVLHDRQLESRHVEIRQVLERWFVVPLNGSQGLALNGLDVRGQSRLNLGDALTLGSVTYTVGFEEVVEREVGTPPTSTSGVPRLGEYFLRRGIMTSEQVARAAERQAALQNSGTRLPFGQVAYDMGFINRAQLDAALSEQRSDFNDRFWD
ncbi:MAG TPA: FHA domain-containing protein [Roseiflexaceae bacterium]|nr:FHA domain-containing protein [Roseiflexaceae bacterium]